GFGGLDSDNGTDVVIGLDDSAYVTGSFRGAISFGEHSLISEGGSDAFLVKVDSQGSVLWAKNISGPGDDNGLALSVSADGSVLWTGFHSSNSSADSTALEDFGGLDTFLAKVGVDGSYAWVRSVGGLGDDSGEAISADPSGGFYLAGNVVNESPSDLFLLRYDQNGILSWAKKAGGASTDTVASIAADLTGVYLTGSFEGTATFEDILLTSQGSSDAYLAKYSPSGSVVWAKSFGGLGTDDSYRIDLDPFGNPCLLGSFEGAMSYGDQVLASKGSRDLFLSKTSSSSGQLIWSRSIGGETLDSAHGLSIGSEGSTHLASHYLGNSLTIDSQTVTSTGSDGFAVAKLGAPHGLPTSSLPEIDTLVTGQSFGFDMNATSNSGILPRFQFISGPNWMNLQDRGNGSALLAGIPPAGSSGSYNAKIRITDMQGGTVDKSLEFDVFKSLSEPTGFADEPETLWLQPGQGGEFANGVAASGDGGFFVVGAFTGSTQIGGVILAAKGRTDSFVAKFNSAGKLEWADRFGGLDQDYAYAVDVDLNGVAYVAGYFTGTATFGSHVLKSSGGYDVYFLRIEPDGQVTWALSFGGSSEDYGKAVHAAPNGSVYLAGHFSDFAIFGNSFLNSNGGEDGFVAKINGSNGSLEWVKNMGGQNSDRALDLTEDGNNGVAVAGRFESVATFGDHSVTSLGFGDAFLARYDASGSCLFAVRAGGTGEDEGRAVVRSSTGSYLFGGNFRNSSTFGGHAILSRGGSDAFLAWISPYGSFTSVTSLGGVWSDEVVDLALDVSGKPIVVGSFRGSVEFGSNTFSSRGDSDAFIAKLSDTNSSVMWVKTGGGVGADAARGVAVDSLFDRICLAGYVSPDATFDNLAASGDTTRRSLLIADLGYPSVDDTRFRSYPLRFATGGALYRYDFESGPWGTGVPTVSAIQLPPWLSLQDYGDGNGSLSGVVPSDANGTYSITLVASDDSFSTISQTFSLVVGSSNGSPVIIASPSTRAVPLEEYSFDLNVFDPEGDVVLIYATNLPSWLKLERHGNGTATVSGVPTNASGAVEEIEIIVTDGKHETRLSFSIEIASSWWGTSENLGAGQWRRNWFGTFSLSMSSWIYHEHLGWVFAEGTQPDSVWFWMDGWGWFWTSSQHWNSDTGEGHVYRSDEATWLYLRSYDSPKNAKLYLYSTEKWMPLLLEGN
ncbi:MAG: Ig domain-containing protein, partial [Opitutales bacterium]|nr:Ig domain-containing protein [Opitutales bacterium]